MGGGLGVGLFVMPVESVLFDLGCCGCYGKIEDFVEVLFMGNSGAGRE